MRYGLLQKAKGLFSSTGRNRADSETRSPYYSDSEKELIRRELKHHNDAASNVRTKRGHATNPRVLAARKAGANI